MRVLNTLLAAAALSVSAGVASAATITSGGGNDCSGVFGQGFDNCVFDYGDYESPVIAKIGWPEAETEYNDKVFESLGGDEVAHGDMDYSDGWYTVTYTMGVDDPYATVFIVKAANGWTAYDADDSNAGDGEGWFELVENVYTFYFTERNVSHVSIYDTGTPPEVPLPAAGFLLLGGLGGLAMMRRRAK